MKFADDGTVWISGTDLAEMVKVIESDLEGIRLNWLKKWRMKVNIDKTEYCIFSKDPEILDMDIKLKLEWQTLF